VTFLIGVDGKIERAIEVSDIPGHIEDLLKSVESSPTK
jgi:hypothetical protein